MNKNRLARAFRKFPLFGLLFVVLYRMTQPRVTAGVTGVLLDDQNRVLLVEHVFHARHPWGLPGGWLDRHEEPSLAIIREFREETGLDVEIVIPLLVAQGRMWRGHLDIAYLLRVGHPVPPLELSYELSNYGWFPLDDLPPVAKFTREVLGLVSALKESELAL